jgi:hypothetical protein
MTEERLPLNELLEKAGDGDFLRAVASMREHGRSGLKYPRNTFAPVVANRSPKDGYRVPSFYRIVLPKAPPSQHSHRMRMPVPFQHSATGS